MSRFTGFDNLPPDIPQRQHVTFDLLDPTHPNWKPEYGLSMRSDRVKELGLRGLTKTDFNNKMLELGLPNARVSSGWSTDTVKDKLVDVVKAIAAMKTIGTLAGSVGTAGTAAGTAAATQGDNDMITDENKFVPTGGRAGSEQTYNPARDGLPADASTTIEQNINPDASKPFTFNFGGIGNNNNRGFDGGQLTQDLLYSAGSNIIGNWAQGQRYEDAINANIAGQQKMFDTFYPGTTQWERLGAAAGAGASGIGSGISGTEQHRMARELKKMDNNAARDVANINAEQAGLTKAKIEQAEAEKQLTQSEKALVDKQTKYAGFRNITGGFQDIGVGAGAIIHGGTSINQQSKDARYWRKYNRR